MINRPCLNSPFYKRLLYTIISIFILSCSPGNKSEIRGPLFIIGGGSRPESMIREMIKVAGGDQSRIVIVPYASGVASETADYQIRQFIQAGAENTASVDPDSMFIDREENLRLLAEADGFFLSGGDQRRLTRLMLGTQALGIIQQKYSEGVMIAGTSAGAAVMSSLMITGDERKHSGDDSPFATIESENIVTTPGFGFLDGAVIDQHFIARKRHNRLMSLVAENPNLLGIGIDESTAIVVESDNSLRVFGQSQVLVYDARTASVSFNEAGLPSITGMTLTLLVHGNEYHSAKPLRLSN